MVPREIIVQAIKAGHFHDIRSHIHGWLRVDGARPLPPLELSYLASYAMHARDEEVRRIVHENAMRYELSPDDSIDSREGLALSFFHLGVSFLPDVSAATEWLDKSLAAIPGFPPAAVEREIIRRGLNRDATLNCLADDVPVVAWRYDAAAAQLSLPGNTKLAVSKPDQGQAVGLALRGLCHERTPALLRHYRRAIGDRPLYLSTWEDTDSAILHTARDLCDEVVLVPNVENPGQQNRVRQILLSQAAIEIAAKKCDFLLLTRTDIAIFKYNFLDILVAVWKQFPISDSRLRGRFIVPDIFTRKYFTDHPSDMLTFGTTDDLAQLWGCVPSSDDSPDLFPEVYVSRQFRKKLGIYRGDAHLTTWENWAYLRDYFIVRDFSWLESWWLGRGNMQRAATTQMDYQGLVSQSDWEAMQFTPQGYPSEFGWAPNMRGAMMECLFPHSTR